MAYPGQRRAVVGARIANMRQGERTDLEPSANLPNVISQSQAAELLNVSERSIKSVKAIEREAPDLIQEIVEGKITVGAAEKKIKQKRRGNIKRFT